MDINALRSAFQKKSEQADGNVGFWDKFYPFYKMNFDEIAVFRFIQDADQDNPMGFIVENKYHELMINGKKKRIACLKMYGEACPCCEISSKYYDSGDTKMGKVFYRKIDYIAQGLVITSPFDYPIKPDENPIRLVSMSKQLYEKVETEIVKGDLDNMPFDMESGYDFRIIKTKKTVPGANGQPPKEYGNYSESGFARKQSPIPTEFLEHLQPLDLKAYRFTKIERDQMELLIESFLTGKQYEDKEGEKKEESGVTRLETAVAAPKEVAPADAVVAAASTESAAPAPKESAAAPAKLSPQEILRQIKERNSQRQ